MKRLLAATPNNSSQVLSVKEHLSIVVREEYLNEMRDIIKELHRLFPRFKLQVDASWYAATRQEVMRLTVSVCDETHDIDTLEPLLQYLKWHQQLFLTALSEPESDATY